MDIPNELRQPSEAKINANPARPLGTCLHDRLRATQPLANFSRNKSDIELSIDRALRQLKIHQAARIASTPKVEQPVPPAEPVPAPRRITRAINTTRIL